MGEIKSVKVDNWGVFFLQKLQNFFNKTDYCDLTLQFRDNSQLKVHRLVLSACTDYFNVLEQTCEVVDDAIIMPNGLQADVVVPIVNFMYTGTLEFELKMYGRLLKTAKDMNMTVLLKLLEAHRRTMEMHPQKNQETVGQKYKRRAGGDIVSASAASTSGRSLIQTQQARRIGVTGSTSSSDYQAPRSAQANIYSRVSTTSSSGSNLLPVKQQIGSTTFKRIKMETEQDENVSGGHTILKRAAQQHAPTSPFEQLRKGYSNNKRPVSTTFISPPAKKPNLEDVKEFAEQQRMRKQIAAEYGDDGDYDAGILDDDTIHNDDDDDDVGSSAAMPTSASAAVQTSSAQHHAEDPPGTTTIIVKHEGPDKPPTIVVKDSSNSKVNHSKIISEVLRQYPHLVNSNKNIKLKIMPNSGGQTQKIIVKKEPIETEKNRASTPVSLPTVSRSEDKKPTPSPSSSTSGRSKLPTAPAASDSTSRSTTTGSSNTSAGTSSAPPQKRRIDSKTMHALIALGAENTTGPWLCLRCGRNGHPISIPSYRGFRRHLVNTHKEYIDPALCEHCGWRSSGKRELHFHMQIEHKINTTLYIFPECQLCMQICIDSDALNQHLIDSHPDENKQQCIYCNKIFPEEYLLYTHMKTFHKKQSIEDGIIDYSDDDNGNAELEFPPPLDDQEIEEATQGKKIKILSDISLPMDSSIVKTDSVTSSTTSAAEPSSAAAREAYLREQQEHVETKFVAADGSEVILTDEQRKEILSQLNQEIMVMSESQTEHGVLSNDENSQATTATNDERDEQCDSQIYNELKSDTEQEAGAEIKSQTKRARSKLEMLGEDDEQEHELEESADRHDEALDESKESADNLEWAENLLSEHDMADDDNTTLAQQNKNLENARKDETGSKDEDDAKSQDDMTKKLKELAGDWSEDDDEEEDTVGSPAKVENVEEDQVEKEIKACKTEDKKEEETISEAPNTSETELPEEALSVELPEALNRPEVVEDEEALAEDDVDLALKSMHKDDKEEDDDVDDQEISGTKEVQNEEAETNKADTQDEVDVPETTETKCVATTSEVNSDEQVTSSAAIVGESKDLLQVLKSEHTDDVNESQTDEKRDDEVRKDESDVTENEPLSKEEQLDEPMAEAEFLDSTPEAKIEDLPDITTALPAAENAEAASSSTEPQKDAVSSEERVKSLISEWGDDDEEEENADSNEAEKL